jgi:hypothetical protein
MAATTYRKYSIAVSFLRSLLPKKRKIKEKSCYNREHHTQQALNLRPIGFLSTCIRATIVTLGLALASVFFFFTKSRQHYDSLIL